MGRKGHRSRRGIGEIYDEPKTQRRLILLTKTADNKLVKLANDRNISLSEVVEQLLRDSGTDHGIEIDEEQ